jgi:hypothetical protein
MPGNIFINYRKDDSRWHTHSLHNELLKYFRKDTIFKDFSTIRLGEDYVEAISKALERCSVLLVVIGKEWLNVKNQSGIQRLHDSSDLVRVEIATALNRKINVIPVFFDNVQMFKEAELPEDLQPLTKRQSISISDVKFEADVQKLAEDIKTILGREPSNASVKQVFDRIYFKVEETITPGNSCGRSKLCVTLHCILCYHQYL